MGNIIRRGWKDFNVESRAHRYIDRHIEKPVPPPRHPTTERLLKKAQQDTPELMQKNEPLHDRLKQVMVDSTEVKGKPLDVEIDKDIPRSSSRSLPQMRSFVGSPDLFPGEVPVGRISVPRAMELLAKHKQDKKKWTSERLSQDFKMNLDDTRDILENFQAFKIIPQNPNEPNPKLPIYDKRELTAD